MTVLYLRQSAKRRKAKARGRFDGPARVVDHARESACERICLRLFRDRRVIAQPYPLMSAASQATTLPAEAHVTRSARIAVGANREHRFKDDVEVE